jgi:hypothetical protein
MASASTTVDIGSVRATLIALEHTTGDMESAARAALAAGAKELLAAARKVLSVTDHTSKDLAALGHPYAVRHGKIMIHRQAPWKVHTHTGRLLRALKDAAYDVGDAPAHMVYLDASDAPYVRAIIAGTDTMLPRDPLWTGTALQPAVQKRVMRSIVKVLGKELRTKMGVRFESRAGSGSVL